MFYFNYICDLDYLYLNIHFWDSGFKEWNQHWWVNAGNPLISCHALDSTWWNRPATHSSSGNGGKILERKFIDIPLPPTQDSFIDVLYAIVKFKNSEELMILLSQNARVQFYLWETNNSTCATAKTKLLHLCTTNLSVYLNKTTWY